MPGKFHGQKSLAGYNPWGLKESDMTEAAEHTNRVFFTEQVVLCAFLFKTLMFFFRKVLWKLF